MCVCVCVCVCVLGGGQIKVKSNFVFLSIYPLFIILPHFPFSPLRQIPSPHYWTTFLSPSYPLCKQSLSSAPCRLRVGIVSPQPPRHSNATVTFTFRHFAWGLLLWSLATAVCSHPLNFIYPNLSDSWGGGHKRAKHTNVHVQSSLYVIHCGVYLSLKTACSAPFTHCSPLIHSFTLLWVRCRFSKLEVLGSNDSHHSLCQHLHSLNHHISRLLAPHCLSFHTVSPFPS